MLYGMVEDTSWASTTLTGRPISARCSCRRCLVHSSALTGILRSATADLSTTVTWALMTSVICWGLLHQAERLPWLAERLYRARRCHDPDEYYLRDRTARLDGVPSLRQHCRRRRADKSALTPRWRPARPWCWGWWAKALSPVLWCWCWASFCWCWASKPKRWGKKIFGIVFAVTGLLGILSLTGVPYLEVGIPGIPQPLF